MLFGRLRPGLDLANLGSALAVLNAAFRWRTRANRKAARWFCTAPARFDFSNGPSQFTKMVAPMAALALGLSMLVLLIACLNLASMMLARGAMRRKEIAMRLALGAGAGRILSKLLTEGLLLALLAVWPGLLLSTWVAVIVSSLASLAARNHWIPSSTSSRIG